MYIFERFDETKLPCKNDCYSTLNDKHISDKDYEYALKIRNKLEMKAVLEYHDLLKTDVWTDDWCFK